MALAVLLNNFMHDFSAAGWIFCTVILMLTAKYELPADRDGRVMIAAILKRILLLMRLSVIGIVGFGIVRAIAYRQYEWSAAAGDDQIVMLAIKHVLLAAVFFVGVVYYRKTIRMIRGGEAT